MKKKIISMLLAAMAVILVFSGCAKSSNGSSKVTVVKVAGFTGYKPYTYLDENGKAAGYDVDVLAAVAKKLPQYKFEWSFVGWDAELVGIQSGKYAFGSANMWETAAREKVYLYEKTPIDYSAVSLVVRKDDNSIKTISDLPGKKIAPLEASNALISVINDYNKKNSGNQIKVENVEGFQGADGIKAVASGRYDAQVLTDSQFNTLAPKLNLNIKKTDPVAFEGAYYLFNKKQSKLCSDIDKALEGLTKDGTLSKLSVKDFGKDVFKEAAKSSNTSETSNS